MTREVSVLEGSPWPTLPVRSVLTSREEYGGDYPLLSLSARSGVRARDLNEGRAASDDLSAYRVVRPGDLVINRLSARDGAYAVAGLTGLASPAYWVLRPGRHVDSRWINYVLQSSPYRAEIARISKFMPPAQFDLPWPLFRKLPIPTPKPSEQRAIVDFLDRETAQIDAMVDAQERLVALLEERRSATIDQVVVAGLATERRSQPLASTEVEIPEHWGQGQLKRFARVQSGLTKNTAQSLSIDDLLEVPYLRVANVQDGHFDLTEIQTLHVPRTVLHRYLLRPGDVLMNEGGDNDKLGRGAVWDGSIAPCVHQNHVFAVRPLDGLLPEWLNYYNQGRVARKHFVTHAVQSTNLASISSTNLMRLPIAVPSLAEQVQLVAYLDRTTARLDSMIAKTQESIALMKERRTAVISAAVSGRLDVRTGEEQLEPELEGATA